MADPDRTPGDVVDIRNRLRRAGGDGGDIGLWEQSVETRLGQLHDDNRSLSDKVDHHFALLLTAFAGGVVLILSAFAGGFLWLVDKLPS